MNRIVIVLTGISLSLSLIACGGGGGGGGSGNGGVNPVVNTFTIGGTVTGLKSAGLVLQNNGGNDLVIAADGVFNFSAAVNDGATFTVTVSQQPDLPPQSCTVVNGSSTLAGSAITNVDVSCVGPFARYMFMAPIADADNSISVYALDKDTGRPVYIRDVDTGTQPEWVVVHPSGKFLYVANVGSDEISQFSIGADGKLSQIAANLSTGSTSGPVSATIDPTGRYLYVTIKNFHSVAQFNIGTNGVLTPMIPTIVSTTTSPVHIAVDPTGKFAYVAEEFDSKLYQFSINANGTLNALTPAFVVPGINPNSVTVDPRGRFVYVANDAEISGGAASIAQYTIGNDGTLTPMSTPSVTPAASTFPKFITINPDSSFAYVSSGGSPAIVTRYAIAADGLLQSPVQETIIGGSPRAAVIGPSAKYFYVTNSTGATFQFPINSDASFAPASPNIAQRDGYESIAISPGAAPVMPVAKFAYVMNQNDSTITQFNIGTDGKLSEITPVINSGYAGTSGVAGTTPTDIAADPGGQKIYVTNSFVDRVSPFTVNTNGSLSIGFDETVLTNNLDPAAVSVDPGGRFVYIAHNEGGAGGPSTMAGYDIGSNDVLTIKGTAGAAIGTLPQSIEMYPDGKYMLIANFVSDDISIKSLNSAGGVASNTTTNAGDGTSDVTFHPNGKYAYATNFFDNNVSLFDVSIGGTLSLTPMTTPTVVAGTNPRAVAVHPSGLYAYVANQASNNVSQYAINQTDGSLTAMSTPTVVSGTGATNPRDITVDASGKYVYVANRNSASVSQFTVNQADGSLTAMNPATVSTGSAPTSIITVDGYQ